MRIFVTGATGFVGSAVVRELLAAGHQVLGLTRSAPGAAALEALGAEPFSGSLTDLDGLRRAAASTDGVIHTGFNHDFSRFAQSCEEDRILIEALGEALAGTTRRLIVTSALGVLPRGALSNESTAPASGAAAHPRAKTEIGAEAAAARGAHVSLVRLPPSVHGVGDHGFVPMLIDIARKNRASSYLDDGANRWPAVHRLDAARLYRLALEASTLAPCYHAVAETGIPFHVLATAIGRGLGVPTVSVPRAEAAAAFGGFEHFAAMDVPATSIQTRDQLGWVPEQLGLLEDLTQGHYFAATEQQQ